MSELFVIVLEAHHRERNHHRRYALRLGIDLFGDYLLTIEFGRVDRAGTELRFGGSSDVVRQELQRRLRRRTSARRRIGCDYKVSSISVAPAMSIQAWLSPEWTTMVGHDSPCRDDPVLR